MDAKKSQSALEYMMTYGWAILIIVIIAAVLYSFGVFNPTSVSVTPFSATGFATVPVTNGQANSTAMSLYISDEAGNDISIKNVSVVINNKQYSNFTCLSNNLTTSQNSQCFIQGLSLTGPEVNALGTITYQSNGLTYNSSGSLRVEISPGNIPPLPCNSFELFSNVTNSTFSKVSYTLSKRSFVALVSASGFGGNITTARMPLGCTQDLFNTSLGGGLVGPSSLSTYIATCNAQAPGTYDFNVTTGKTAYIGSAVYVFNMPSCPFAFNSSVYAGNGGIASPQPSAIYDTATLNSTYGNYLCVGAAQGYLTNVSWSPSVSALNSSWLSASSGSTDNDACTVGSTYDGGIGNHFILTTSILGLK